MTGFYVGHFSMSQLRDRSAYLLAVAHPQTKVALTSSLFEGDRLGGPTCAVKPAPHELCFILDSLQLLICRSVIYFRYSVWWRQRICWSGRLFTQHNSRTINSYGKPRYSHYNVSWLTINLKASDLYSSSNCVYYQRLIPSISICLWCIKLRQTENYRLIDWSSLCELVYSFHCHSFF